MYKVVSSKTRSENGEKVTYEIRNESYEDDYGSLKINYVPYRVGKTRQRLSPENYLLSQLEADDYLRFGKYKTCKHCGSTYFKEDK